MLPDVIVQVSSAPAPRTIPTDTGVAFWVGVTQRGPIGVPRFCQSLQDWTDSFGDRLTTSASYDAVDTFFSPEGGTKLYFTRIVHSDAVAATHTLLDSAAGVSLVVTAGSYGVQDPGAWGNGLTVGVVAVTGGGFQLQVYLNGVFKEASFICQTQADAVAWSNKYSKWIVVTLGATALVPAVVSPVALATGSDGTTTNDADRQAALDAMPRLLGPGQVAAPGHTTSTAGLQLLDHAQTRNRFAQIDGPDTASDATLLTAAAALYGAPNNGRRYGQLLAPWDVAPGLTALTTRTVPPSARACAQYARTDALGNPNQAAAGRNGTARFILDLSQPAWTDTQRLGLNTGGVTVSRRRFSGTIVTYGFRTLADQITDAQWSMAPGVRCVMWYVARAYAIGEAHEFNQVDGFGHEQAALKGDLTAPLLDLLAKDALFVDVTKGGGPETAFYVDTGNGLNPPANLAAGQLVAKVALRTSPGAEQVLVGITKTPITQALA